MLSEASDLKVSARTSAYYFKDRPVSVRAIGLALGAANILEGSVRKSGDLVRVTVQLIRTDSGYHLWSANYDRKPSDLFVTESEIARVVVDRLKASLRDSSAFRDRLSADPAARTLYLRSLTAVYHDTPESQQQAVKDLRHAVEIDPRFAMAWTLLAIAAYDPLERRRAADRALEIDPWLPGAHVSKALDFAAAWDVPAAIGEVNRALELDPNDSFALRNAADLQADLGHFEAAERLAREAESRSQIDAYAHATLGWVLSFNGKLPEAIEQLQNAVSLNPSSDWLRLPLAWVQFLSGDAKTALDTIDRPENSPEVRQFARPTMLDALGQHAQADREQAIAEKKFGGAQGAELALLYAYRGDNDRAFAWLDEAFKAHEEGLVFIKQYHGFDSLHTDPRYRALLKKLKLPE